MYKTSVATWELRQIYHLHLKIVTNIIWIILIISHHF
jgi:hypothetical protein